MQEFDQIIKLAEDDVVELGQKMKEFLHTKLVLGQSEWVCRYGTLSDGFETMTPAQRYFQAIKELWIRSGAMKEQEAVAMLSQAELMDAQEELEKAQKPSEKIRAKAKVKLAQHRLTQALVTMEDQMRQIKAFNAVREELEPIVEAQYPGGYEQAEPDNWKAKLEYRMLKNPMGERLDNICLDPVTKAELGLKYGRVDAIAPLAVASNLSLENKTRSDIQNFIESKKQEGLHSEPQLLSSQK